MQDGSTALIWAAYGGHLAIVQELLERGANIEAQSTVMRGDGALTLTITPTLTLTLPLILTFYVTLILILTLTLTLTNPNLTPQP